MIGFIIGLIIGAVAATCIIALIIVSGDDE